MKNGMNVWVNAETGQKVKSESRPDGEYWFAAYPESRVRGDKYTPYHGTGEWIRAANAEMKAAAQYNFQQEGK